MIHYNVPGAKRKELVKTIALWLGEEIHYRGAPTFAYEVGGYTVDRDGSLFPGENTSKETTERLCQHLADEGFECDLTEHLKQPEKTEEGKLDISVPTDTLTDEQFENLAKLVAAKAGLLKKALQIKDLAIIKRQDAIHFPWFPADAGVDAAGTYMRLIKKLTAFAKNAKRVTAKKKTAENDKYAFRCFLLRLGFIGDEYKADRKLLLANLEGNSAFKAGKKEDA